MGLRMLRAIDVCAGVGGWAVGARGLPVEIVVAFDREEDCLETYRLNHPGVECVQCDVIEHDFSGYAGKVDLVLGGIPCEDISAARRNVPLSDAKKVSFEYLLDKCLSIPRLIGARWWCYEDVVDVLRYTPLFTSHFILDSQEFGPQRRKRAYLGNCPKPAGQGNAELLRDCLRPGPYRKSLQIRDRVPQRGGVYDKDSKGFYPWMPEEKSPTVIGLNSRHDNYAAAAFGDDWRSMQWQELALLQGFPEDYVFMGTPTRVMKMVAQAVEVRTAHAILAALCAEAMRVKGESQLIHHEDTKGTKDF